VPLALFLASLTRSEPWHLCRSWKGGTTLITATIQILYGMAFQMMTFGCQMGLRYKAIVSSDSFGKN
jgi:hypothetical protein